MDITLVQAELHWEDREANIRMLDNVLNALGKTDLIVLPEMFTTAFSNRSKDLAETMDGPTLAWMREKAKENGATITGSVMISDKGENFNRMLWVRPDGEVSHYDKRHLFRMAGEHDHFSQGKERVIVELNGWRVMLQVCYDLRFPVFSRNRYMNGQYEYDLILYVANWPKPRHNAWSGLLRARAMENLAYCVGVNRVGQDANGLDYKGGSAIIDFLGNPREEA
ncbi:MAG: amidohydrolase, partial [Flavobacteriales bacterium]|nr:amidohydrolase [Flavobacteriales bacterium]